MPHHVIDEDLELYVFGHLAEAKVGPLESHLTGCESCRCKLADALEFKRQLTDLTERQTAFQGQEKRSEPRIPAHDSASMRTLNPINRELLNVQVLDTSQSGLKLCTRAFLEAGTIVQLHWKDKVVMGEVRYCMPVGKWFYVGITIQDMM